MNDIQLPRLGDDTPQDRPQRKWEEFFYPKPAPARPEIFDRLLAEAERHDAFMRKSTPESIPWDDARRQSIAARVKIDSLVQVALKTIKQEADPKAAEADAAQEARRAEEQRAWIEADAARREEKLRAARERRELDAAAREGLEPEDRSSSAKRADRLADAMGETMRRSRHMGAVGVAEVVPTSGPEVDENVVELRPGGGAGAPVRAPVLISALDLYHKKFPPIDWVIEGFIAAGTLSILAGKPKIGKSFLALQAGLAVARGTEFLGMKVGGGGPVWYLGLEDSERRMNYRITGQLGAGVAPPAGLGVATWWPRMGQGDDGLGWIKRISGEIGAPRLVVIDTYARFRARMAGARTGTIYTQEYDDIAPLVELCGDLGSAVLLVHHLNKSDNGDAFDRISGSVAMQGAVDCMMVLDRDRSAAEMSATLSVHARDFEGFEAALEFEKVPCTWKSLGAASVVHATEDQEALLVVLRELGGSGSVAMIAAGTEPRKTKVAVQKALGRMKVGRLVEVSGVGPKAVWRILE